MAETKTPLDQAVELFVYAPIGLAVAARDLVPTLVERGRRQVDPQVEMARTIGQFAVARGRSQAEKALESALDRAWAQAEATLRQLGILPEASPATSTRPATPDGPRVAPPPPPAPTAPSAPTRSATTASPAAAQPSPVDLSIPDYDSLSASQVLPRLSSLSISELAAVRAYEEAHRGRKTILHKIAQLEAT